MFRNLRRRYDFANIQRDRWLAANGSLSEQEAVRLRIRERRFAQYTFLKAIVLFPVALVRAFANAVRILREFETLHAGPRRRIRAGKNCVIDQQTWLVNGHHIRLGDNVKISVFSTVIAGNVAEIHIGTNTIIGPGVTIVAINHGTAAHDGPIRFQEWKESPVTIGDDVWIGSGAIVLPGAIIGSGTVIGAGTIVRGTIRPGVIAYMSSGALVTKDRQ